jgi:hypothetical protein
MPFASGGAAFRKMGTALRRDELAKLCSCKVGESREFGFFSSVESKALSQVCAVCSPKGGLMSAARYFPTTHLVA